MAAKKSPEKKAAAGVREIALFRAVNVGGTGKLPMEALRALFEKLGFREVKTLLNSGNITFAASGKSPAALEKEIETAVAEKLGVVTEVFVRTAAEWDELVANNPFLEEAKSDPGRLIVLALKSAPDAKQLAALQEAAKARGREQVRAKGRAAYIYYPDGSGESKLTGPVIERHLNTRATGRNWNTVLKLARMANGS